LKVKKIPKLHTAAELGPTLRVSAQRMLELAEAGFMPHWKIDGGEPLFEYAECRKWVCDHLAERFDGSPLPVTLCVSLPGPHVDSHQLPQPLKAFRNLTEITETVFDGSGVYFLCLADEVVYVGQSGSVAHRVKSHVQDKRFDRVFWMRWPAHDLDRLERAMIRLLGPKYNGLFNPETLRLSITEKEFIAALQVCGDRYTQMSTQHKCGTLEN
jgi:hypothetical protein